MPMTEPADARPQRRGWLRRNLLPLAALGVMLPLTGFVVAGLPVIDVAGRMTAPQEVPFGESAEVAGWQLELVDSVEIAGTGIDGNGIPTGMAIVAALIELRPQAGADVEMYCDAELTSRATGVERSWSELTRPSTFRYQIGEENDDLCHPEGELERYETVYLAPEGTSGVATIDVSVSTDERAELRFELAP
jgi:hypothetical protein